MEKDQRFDAVQSSISEGDMERARAQVWAITEQDPRDPLILIKCASLLMVIEDGKGSAELLDRVIGVLPSQEEDRLSIATAMRGGSIADRAQAEGMLGAAMMNLMAVAENYPQLKADTNFLQLQSELSDIENKIAAARRFFNNATSEYNTVIHQFPAVLVARMFGFKEEVFFELDGAEKDAVKTAPNVSFG